MVRGILKFVLAIVVAIASIVGLIAAAFGFVLVTTPNPDNIKTCIVTNMYKVRLCPNDPTYATYNKISSHLKNAVIVSEDSTFFTHNGFDYFELRSSLEKNLEKGEFARGGSTITQQLAKNVYLSSEKSLLRKLREVLITIQLEKLLTKEEILEKYLNVVEFGENLYGVGPASRHYFNKSPSQLTPAESAFLAFLLPSPKKYSVSFRKKQLTPFARSQTRIIVKRLNAFRMLSGDQQAEALAQVDYLFGGQPIVIGGDDSAIAPSAEEAGDSEDWINNFEASRKKSRQEQPEGAPPADVPIDPELDDPETADDGDSAANPVLSPYEESSEAPVEEQIE